MEKLGVILTALCDRLNGALGTKMDFLPGSGEGELPAMGEKPVGWVRLLPEAVVVHAYVDGTSRYEIPFAVYVRIDGSAPLAHTQVLDRFGEITAVLATYAAGVGRCRLTRMPGIEKMERGSAVVYRAGYCLSGDGSVGGDTIIDDTSILDISSGENFTNAGAGEGGDCGWTSGFVTSGSCVVKSGGTT